MKWQLSGLAAVVILFAGVASGDDKKELDRFQGEWVYVSSEKDGKKTPEEELKGVVRTIKGDQYTLSKGDKVLARGTIKVDPSKKPATIDVMRSDGDRALLGIYEFDGDTQKVCLAAPGKDRPREFSAKEGSGNTLTVWKKK